MSAGSRKGALIFGLILIGIGLVFLLANWYSTFALGHLIVLYWPLLPILIGAKKLYGYATWKEDAAVPDASPRRARRRRPSLLGGLLWVALGALFLLRNFGTGPDLWSMAGRYWPILLILLGLGKVIDHFRQEEGVSIKFGEVFGLLLVFIIGSAISRIPNSALRDIMMSPIHIGGTDVNLGTSYAYTDEAAYPLRPGLVLRIENSNGQVSVTPGSDGEVRVRLRKVVFENEEARAKDIAGQIRIEGGEEGKAEASAFVLKTNREDLSAKNLQFNTDMDVLVPKQVQLEIRNPFGGVNVSNLDCKLQTQSSHQPLEVHDCSGSFAFENRYGESRLTNLTGNVTLNARGRVTVQTVRGDVDVRNEYSSVSINDIEGKLSVQNTEGGSIVVDRVSKPVTIDAPGTRVTVSNLADSVQINSSHQRIQVTDVIANVMLSSSYSSSAVIKRVKGNVDITSNSDRVNLDEIGGYIKATAQGSSVRINSADGPIEISTTLRDVMVNNFSRGCKVTNENGDITLSTASLGKEDISGRSRNGDINLFLPQDSAFQIDATARNGRISTDFVGLQPLSAGGDTTTLKGRLKAGGPKITLETDYSSIFVRTRENETSGSRDR